MRPAALCLVVGLTGCRFHFRALDDAAALDGPGDAAGDDATDASPAPNYMFTTSGVHDLCAIGMAGADAACAATATAVGLPGTYLAWVSSPTVDARDRFATARGWIRRDGRPFVDQIADLVAGNVIYPPRLDENGSDLAEAAIASATGASGIYDSVNGCMVGGVVTHTAFAWYSNNLVGPSHLVCLGTDRAVPVTAPIAIGRIAFTSVGLFDPSTGRTQADNLCANEATASSLPGTYLAFATTTAGAAASRFTTSSGPAWVRTDGLPLMTAASDLVTWSLLTSIDRHADRSLAVSRVWTGSRLATTVNDTCNDWASHAPNGVKYEADDSSSTFFFTDAMGCTPSLPVFCFQK